MALLATGDMVRDFANLGEEEPLLCLVDVPNQRKHLPMALDPSPKAIADMVASYHAGSIPWMTLDD